MACLAWNGPIRLVVSSCDAGVVSARGQPEVQHPLRLRMVRPQHLVTRVRGFSTAAAKNSSQLRVGLRERLPNVAGTF